MYVIRRIMCPFLRTNVILKSTEIRFIRLGRKKRKKKKKEEEEERNDNVSGARPFSVVSESSNSIAVLSVVLSFNFASLLIGAGSWKLEIIFDGKRWCVARYAEIYSKKKKKSSVSSQRSAPACNKEVKGNKTEKENVLPRSSK